MLLAVANIRAWVRQGGPWKQGHTFTSWSRSFGVDYLDVYWKSFMADKFTDGMVDNTVALFRFVQGTQWLLLFGSLQKHLRTIYTLHVQLPQQTV